MENVPVTPLEDQREDRISQIQAELQSRRQIIKMINSFNGGYEGFIHDTIKLEGKVDGINETFTYLPPAKPAAAEEAPAAQEGDGI